MSGCNSWKYSIYFSIFLSEKTTFNRTNWWPLLSLFHLTEFSNERRNQIRQEKMFFSGVGGIGWFKMEDDKRQDSQFIINMIGLWKFVSMCDSCNHIPFWPSLIWNSSCEEINKLWPWYTRIFRLKMLRFKSERSTSSAWPQHSKRDVS